MELRSLACPCCSHSCSTVDQLCSHLVTHLPWPLAPSAPRGRISRARQRAGGGGVAQIDPQEGRRGTGRRRPA
eukprot:8806218-Pyramimonas_sp.AAC.1